MQCCTGLARPSHTARNWNQVWQSRIFDKEKFTMVERIDSNWKWLLSSSPPPPVNGTKTRLLHVKWGQIISEGKFVFFFKSKLLICFVISMLYSRLIESWICNASVIDQECLFRRGFIQLSTCTRHVKQGGLFDRRLLRHFEAWEFI